MPIQSDPRAPIDMKINGVDFRFKTPTRKYTKRLYDLIERISKIDEKEGVNIGQVFQDAEDIVKDLLIADDKSIIEEYLTDDELIELPMKLLEENRLNADDAKK